jgi:tetratricopeptide (TPR) repeat protein
VGDRAGEGTTLNNIGEIYRSLGQYPQALEQYRQALAISKAVGDRAGEGGTLNNIGFILGEFQDSNAKRQLRSRSIVPFTLNLANNAMVRSTICTDLETTFVLRWNRANQ